MKIALVTGSTRGIGRGIADVLLKNAYRVVYSGTNAVRPSAVPDEGDYFGCDISIAGQRKAVFEYIRRAYGRLDLLVNNAGVAPEVRMDLLDTTEESFDRVLGINLKGTFFMCQAAARLMVDTLGKNTGYSPRIVNIGSISAYTSSSNRGEYCVSKAGVAMVTQLFADRLAEAGIPVFEIRPGIIDTDMVKPVRGKYARLIEDGLTPIKRFGRPEDVADAVLAVAGGLLDFQTGQVLNADGGFHIRRL